MFIIVLNQNNIVADGQNNKLIYKFPNSILLKDKYIAVSSIAMFYSWNNISSTAGNNYFTYTWTAGAVTTTYTISIPDGLYEIVDLNNLIQYTCIANGTYYKLSSGLNVYPFELLVNPNRYAIQLNTYLVPSVAPVGATIYNALPTTPQNPVVTFPANFNIIVGYDAGFASNANLNNTYTPSGSYISKTATGTLSYISTSSPQVQPNSNLLFSLSNVNNPYSQPSSIIYSINPSGVAIGGAVIDKPPNYSWVKMIDGTYNELRMAILGTDGRPIQINDPNMTILLTIRDKDEAFLATK